MHCVPLHEDTRDKCNIYPYTLFHLMCWDRVTLSLELIHLARQFSPGTPGICLFPWCWHWGSKSAPPHLSLCGCWEPKLCSSLLYCKHFIQAAAPEPQVSLDAARSPQPPPSTPSRFCLKPPPPDNSRLPRQEGGPWVWTPLTPLHTLPCVIQLPAEAEPSNCSRVLYFFLWFWHLFILSAHVQVLMGYVDIWRAEGKLVMLCSPSTTCFLGRLGSKNL